jgi:endoglycosylceramidase
MDRQNLVIAACVVSGFVFVGACSDSGESSVPDRGVADSGSKSDLRVDASSEMPPALCEASAVALSTLRVTAEGRAFRDELGRQVLLRGVNVGGRSKFPPFLPFPFQESGRPEQADDPPFAEALEAYVDRVEEWGHNVVRVPFTWEAVEPERGVDDETFVARYESMIRAFGARDIRVIVDFHQDLFARPYCGDGFPFWTLAEPIPPIPEVSSCKTWFQRYLSDELVHQAFDRFWTNQDGLMDAFESMWQRMSARMWNVPGVIGFEPINEPHQGTAFSQTWGRDTLTPFYSKMVGVIRGEAPDALVFFESSGQDSLSAETFLERPEGDGLVYAPHYYHPAVFIVGASNASYDLEPGFATLEGRGEGWNVPVLVGEFGGDTSDDGTAAYMAANYDELDKHLLSGTAWEYSSTKDDWNDEGFGFVGYQGVEKPTAASVVRPYPSAISGQLKKFSYDSDLRSGSVVFEASTSIAGGISELIMPLRLYPDGRQVSIVKGEGCVVVDPNHNRVLIRAASDGEIEIQFSGI